MPPLRGLSEKRPVSKGEIALGRSPFARYTFPGEFLQRFAIGSDSLRQQRRAALPSTEMQQRVAEIILGTSPIEWRTLAGKFIQGFATGDDSLLEPHDA